MPRKQPAADPASEDEAAAASDAGVGQVDVRMDPFDDPETDGLDAHAVPDDEDLNGIEDDPARAQGLLNDLVSD